MRNLSDKLLLEAYEKAVELNLESDFISMLMQEIKDRYLHVNCDMLDENTGIVNN